jgi:hypothetical protein
MTRLEFIFNDQLGRPTRCDGDGQSFWACPECGHCRFHTMPTKPPNKDRFWCWGCPFKGDTMDALAYFYPKENYPQRKARLQDITEEWKRSPEKYSSPGNAQFFSSGEAGRISKTDDREIAAAWAYLTEAERTLLIEARDLMTTKAPKLAFDSLADYCTSMAFSAWETDLQQRTAALMAEDGEK